MVTQREQQVLDLIIADPMISQQSIADRLQISRSAVAGHIMKLTNKGVIKGRAYVVNQAPFVVAIGGANIDVHGRPSRPLKLRDSNPGTVTTSPGGVGRNIAENLSRLGVETRLISAVGDDYHGRLVIEQGRAAGIDMQHVLVSDSAPTSTYLSTLDRSGDMYVAINDMAVIEELSANVLQSHESILREAELVVVDTNLPVDALTWLAESLNKTPLFVDTVSAVKAPKIQSLLGAIHTLKANEAEAEALSGIPARTQADRRRLADWFHARGVERLFVTLGKQGVFYSSADSRSLEKPEQASKTSRNTSGAGDAFLAGLALAWIESQPLRYSVRFALAAAALTISDDATSSTRLSRSAVERAMA